MAFCSHCGEPAQDDAAFCTRCGKPIREEAPSPAPRVGLSRSVARGCAAIPYSAAASRTSTIVTSADPFR